jgi:hypothetical protein
LKKLIASRKLKRRCIVCNTEFEKGDVYYKKRMVYVERAWRHSVIFTLEMLMCPKCKFEEEQHNIRFSKFQETCTHPDKFIKTKWSYIPGEYVKEPDYDFCSLCDKKLGGD